MRTCLSFKNMCMHYIHIPLRLHLQFCWSHLGIGLWTHLQGLQNTCEKNKQHLRRETVNNDQIQTSQAVSFHIQPPILQELRAFRLDSTDHMSKSDFKRVFSQLFHLHSPSQSDHFLSVCFMQISLYITNQSCIIKDTLM